MMTSEQLAEVERRLESVNHGYDAPASAVYRLHVGWLLNDRKETISYLEGMRDGALVRIKDLETERDKLQAFKDWVHAYLDGKGVPHSPPGVHGAEGCRIGDRMDWVFAQLKRLEEVTVQQGYAQAAKE